MSIHGISGILDSATAGMRAQSARLSVAAGNIAQSSTTRTPSGDPYRRQHVILTAGVDGMGPVVERIVPDYGSDFKTVHMPGHPDADSKGYVRMPNIELPTEMINMTIASRAYQANAAVMKRYQDMVDVALELLK